MDVVCLINEQDLILGQEERDQEGSRGIKRDQEGSRGIKRDQEGSGGIKRDQEG